MILQDHGEKGVTTLLLKAKNLQFRVLSKLLKIPGLKINKYALVLLFMEEVGPKSSHILKKIQFLGKINRVQQLQRA